MTIGLVVKNGKNSQKITTIHAAESLRGMLNISFPVKSVDMIFLEFMILALLLDATD